MKRDAVFLDRDGVIVQEVYYPQFGEKEAPIRPEDVRLFPGAAQALRDFRAQGFFLVLVSNQGAVAKGKVGLRSLWETHDRMVALLAEEETRLDAEYYSFSHPAGTVPFFSGVSLDRKPSPYNILIAAARYNLDIHRSWMIGDRETDVQCGRKAGTRTIRVFSEVPGKSDADFRVTSLSECVEIVRTASQTLDHAISPNTYPGPSAAC